MLRTGVDLNQMRVCVTSSDTFTRLSIYPKPPFDFEKSASIHGRFKRHIPDVYENGVYKRVIHLEQKPALLSFSSVGTRERPKLGVAAYPRIGFSQVKPLTIVLQAMFAPSFDFAGFYRVARKDAVMKTIALKLKGLRPIAPPTVFESVIIAITEQQISLDAAIAIRSRLVERYGDRIVVDGKTYYAFPTAKSLAWRKPQEIRAVGLSIRKSEYINAFSRKVSRGEFDPESLRKMDDERAVLELTKIKGIGRWTAEYVLVRGMGRVNSLPADDLGIQRAVSQAYFKGKEVSSENVRRTLARFSPYSGIAAFYLMYSLFWERVENKLA
jgi:DNA-3-methyladenine glycosylase II